jgi:hypothetical protein
MLPPPQATRYKKQECNTMQESKGKTEADRSKGIKKSTEKIEQGKETTNRLDASAPVRQVLVSRRATSSDGAENNVGQCSVVAAGHELLGWRHGGHAEDGSWHIA